MNELSSAGNEFNATGPVPHRDHRRNPRLGYKLWAFALLAIACAGGLASLGYWQLQRAAAKQQLLDGIEQAAVAPVLAFADLPNELEDLSFRAVRLNGSYLSQYQVLLDNQLRDGVPGVRAYVPLQLANDARVVLVDRGWLARPDRSSTLPVAPTPVGDVSVEGVLLPPPGAGMALGPVLADSWPLLLTRMDQPDIARRLGRPLLDWVLEDRTAPRAQSIRAGMLPPERHRGYALQWFGLSLTVLIIYAVLAWRAWHAARRA